MIGFVVAMKKEGNLFLNNSIITNQIQHAGKDIYIGKYANKDFVLIISGIGKVNASMATQILIDKYGVDKIINFGVAGGKANSDLIAGDITLISEVCQYDFDLSEIDDVSIGYMQDYDTIYYPTAYENIKNNTTFKINKCASADRFTKNKYWLELIADLGGEVVDMECGAIAQVCHANNTPLYIIKLISDVDGSDESIFEQYYNNVQEICKKIPQAIDELLSLI